MQYFEDFPAGRRLDMGPFHVKAEDTIRFARQFDPQPFHLDEEAGKKSLFGGLSASGWHTAAIGMRMIFDGFLKDTASQGSPGIPKLRWTKPVRPGDALRLQGVVAASKASASKPDRGFVTIDYEMRDEAGELKLQMTATHLLRRREAAQ